MTNKQLCAWYKRYNKKYFRNKLPKSLHVRFAKLRKDDFGVTTFLNGPLLIEIARDIHGWGRLVRIVLLHEMAHVSLPEDEFHGRNWQKRMLKLAKQGAFEGLW